MTGRWVGRWGRWEKYVRRSLSDAFPIAWRALSYFMENDNHFVIGNIIGKTGPPPPAVTALASLSPTLQVTLLAHQTLLRSEALLWQPARLDKVAARASPAPATPPARS